MRLNKIMMAALLSISSVSLAHANQGKITFEGAIIDAPCSISAKSMDQTIQMGGISNALLSKNTNSGESEPQSFSIQLENCTVATAGTKDKVQVTFSGPSTNYDTDSFGMVGDAQGAYLILTGADGTKVKQNEPTSVQSFIDGSSPNLTFSARIKGGGSTANITPGAFSVPLSFMLSYP